MSEERQPGPAIEGRFSDDVALRVVGYGSHILLVQADKAYPPGRPLSLTVDREGESLPLSGRCIGSKRRQDGRYDVRIRMTNLTRVARLYLEATLR